MTNITSTFLRLTIFLVNAIHSTIFHVFLQNLTRYSISLIARMSTKWGNIRTETRSWRPKWPIIMIIGHYFFNMRNIWKTGPDSYYRTKCAFPGRDIPRKISTWKNSKWPTCGHFRSSNFLDYNVIHSTFFYVSLQNAYQISIPLIARMSLKLGKIRTETRSWRPKWSIIGHYFFNMRNIWKTRPDS